MSIATSLSALQQAKTDIATAITNKGGTVNQGDGMSDFATDIGTIPTGSEPVIQSKTITANGTYTAPEGVDGYSPVVVNTDPAKGFVLENYDSDGYPTTGRFVGNWSGAFTPHYFRGCFGHSEFLKKILTITIPEGITSIPSYTISETGSSKNYITIILPSTLKRIEDYGMRGFRHNIVFNEGLEYIGAYGCYSIHNPIITVPSSVTTLGNNCFEDSGANSVIFSGQAPNIPQSFTLYSRNIMLYDFSHCTTIPTLYNIASLGHKANCVIKVPSALLSAWQTSDVWSGLTDVVWQGV